MGSEQCSSLSQQSIRRSPAYGQHDIVCIGHREYAVISKTIDISIVSQSQLIDHLERRKKVSSPNLIQLCDFRIKKEGSFVDIELDYEYIGMTLAEKAIIWQTTARRPSEGQIGNLIIGVQRGLRELWKLGVGHRCINLDTILCFNSLYKLTDLSMITFLTGYDLARQGDNSQFLSPKLLDYLFHQGTCPIYTIEDDLFSLGMVILAVILQRPPQFFFFTDQCKLKIVHRGKIEQGIQCINRTYSSWISERVVMLLKHGVKL